MAWLGTYAKRILVTAKYTEGGTQRIDATLTDFPALIHISAACGIGGAFDASCVFDELENDANKLKIAITTSDGTTECYGEIEKWDDANEQAWIHAKVPSASHTEDTPLYLYYDKNHAASNKDGTAGNKIGLCADGSAATLAVWSGFEMVQHMVNDNGNVDDSAGNHDGTKVSTAAGPTEVNAKIGRGQDFERDNAERIECGNFLNSEAEVTISLWVKHETIAADQELVSRGEHKSGQTLLFWRDEATPDEYAFLITDDAGHSTGALYSATAAPAAGTWVRVALAFKGNDTANLYIDEVSDGNNPFDMTGIDEIRAGAEQVHLGDDNKGVLRLLDGIMDEVRISLTQRTTAWEKASYYSESDDLLTWGSEETLGWTNIKPLGLTAADFIRINSATMTDLGKMNGAAV